MRGSTTRASASPAPRCTRLDHDVGLRAIPYFGNRARHEVGTETVERRDDESRADCAEGRRPAGEVAPPEPAQPYRLERGAGFRGEVRHRVTRLRTLPELPGAVSR